MNEKKYINFLFINKIYNKLLNKYVFFKIHFYSKIYIIDQNLLYIIIL